MRYIGLDLALACVGLSRLLPHPSSLQHDIIVTNHLCWLYCSSVPNLRSKTEQSSQPFGTLHVPIYHAYGFSNNRVMFHSMFHCFDWKESLNDGISHSFADFMQRDMIRTMNSKFAHQPFSLKSSFRWLCGNNYSSVHLQCKNQDCNHSKKDPA